DDARNRVVAPRLAHGLLGLLDGLGRNRAAVDDYGVVEPSLFGLGLHHRAVIAVEPTPECQGFDCHQAASLRVQAPVLGSSVPSHSTSAGPVRVTWSLSSHSTTRSPPGTITVALRPVRRVRAALT